MKTYRPSGMTQGPIQVFDEPDVGANIIFEIPVGREVEVISEPTRAEDPLTGSPYKNPIILLKVVYNEREGWINRRWTR